MSSPMISSCGRAIPEDDDSTLFICSGMQGVKKRFYTPDGGRHGFLQSCIRTDDIDLVATAGISLTSRWSATSRLEATTTKARSSYELWHSILTELGIRVSHVLRHPSHQDHQRLWQSRGYVVVSDDLCIWSDGCIGGNCCELFCGDLEIGNLVNPLGHSVDVGFGWERLHQVLEQVERVDQTTLFDHSLHPIVSDHVRTLSVMRENGIEPGNKGRSYVCRRLLRRVLRIGSGDLPELKDWLVGEQQLRDRSLRQGRRLWRKFHSQPVNFWWETFGILPEEIELLR